MDECTANDELKDNESFYLNLDRNNPTKYAAVIKKNENEFCIEVGLKYGCPYIYDDPQRKEFWPNIVHKKSLKSFASKGLIFHKEVNKKIKDGYLVIDLNVGDNHYLSCPHENSDPKRHDPLFSGISIFGQFSPNESGTAGAFFKMLDDENSIYLLSNFHVMAQFGNTALGSAILQPSIGDAQNEGLCPIENPIAKLFWMNKDCFMDAAIAKLNDGVKVRPKSHSRDEKIKLEGITHPSIGMEVRKCGSRSGTTNSKIRSINCTTNLNNTGQQDIYRNQILTNCLSIPGDSGSVLVNDADYVVGLIHAGNLKNASYANNIMTIFNSKIVKFNKQKLPNITFKEFV